MPKRQILPPAQKAKLDPSLAIVNIVLLLIFFFLTTGSILTSDRVHVALPETTELPIDRLPTPLLQISADGSLILDDEEIETGTLAERTRDAFVLYVLADRDTSATVMLDTLAAEELVAIQVRLVTIHRSEGGEP